MPAEVFVVEESLSSRSKPTSKMAFWDLEEANKAAKEHLDAHADEEDFFNNSACESTMPGTYARRQSPFFLFAAL